MNNDIYTIKRLSKELGQASQNIRRRIVKLDIKAINQDKRTYKNDPLKYSYQNFIELADDFGVSVSNTKVTQSNTNSNTKVIQSNTDDISKDDLIEVLKEQLDVANKSRENLERLLDQQQQLNLSDRNKIKFLEIELGDFTKSKDEKNTSIWKNIFRRKGRDFENE